MINNPSDSVCDYLAELLYEATPDRPADITASSEVGEKLNKPVPGTLPQPSYKSLQPAEQVYVEAPSFDKEKLAKLLSSAPLTSQPSSAPASVKDTKLATLKVIREQTPQRHTSAPESALVAEPEAPTPQAALKEIAWCDNGRPSWAQERFDVLLFKVHGLTLAVPLIALGQIQPITKELTPIFGQAKWFMGLQPTPMGQIKTVNTALFVMPERYDPAFLASAKYVISIDGLNWGLAVDSVQQPRTLEPEDVKWRQGRGLRPWLAGTVKEHMCALIDIPNMGVILAGSDRNTKKS